MPRPCSVCTHPARVSIDDGLIAGQSVRDVSGQYGLSKSAVDRHKLSHVPTALALQGADLEREVQAARQADRWQVQQLRANAWAVKRALQGWGQVRSVEAWAATCHDARQRYRAGRFLIERLGAERFLDPQLMATLWQLRQELLEAYGADSPAMTMVIDLAVMNYANALRIQGWIGDLALTIEHELFAGESLKVTLRQQYGAQVDGFAVEEQLQRLRAQLLPLFQQVNRQLLQNLQALRRPQPGALPMVAIHKAGQVNVAERQVNIQRKGGRASQAVEPH